MAKNKIYEIYAELKDSEPLIHRTFLISETATMAKLAYTMMIAFKMQASHLFCFEIPCDNEFLQVEIINEFTEEYDNVEVIDAVENRIKDIFIEVGEKGTLSYDFGDDWKVDFTIKRIYNDENQNARELPKITKGTGYGILEDIGGINMLNQITEAYKTKTGETYEEYSQYLGKRFNFTKFDKIKLNYNLKKLMKIYVKAYEKMEDLTDKEIACLTES